MKLLQVFQEFMAIDSLPSEVRRVQKDSPISQRASKQNFCSIVRGFVIPTKRGDQLI